MSDSVNISISITGGNADHARHELRRTLKSMGFVPQDDDCAAHLQKLCAAVRAIYAVEPRDLMRRYDEATMEAIHNLRPEAASETPS